MEPMTCSLCGRKADDTLTWTVSVERGRRLVYCEECSREHLRSIEGKLDSDWF
jgi:ribosome-binding protein aMBF1 (putative translation factor)